MECITQTGIFFPEQNAHNLSKQDLKTVESFHNLYFKLLEKKSGLQISWLGHQTGKIPSDLWLYQELIYKEHPDVIIETGTHFGGSAVFLATICALIGKGQVISIDLYPKENLPKCDRLTYLSGSSISNEIISRHPFPGPGLAIRIPGKITKEKLKIVQEADEIFINNLIDKNYYKKIWQAYAALLPVRTVGVMGDSRTFEYICLLRAVISDDGMTADSFFFPKKFLDDISNKIVNNVKGVNRVVYDITTKPPSTIELE